MDALKHYTRKFEKLRIDRTHGDPAPHKPVLLLTVLQGYWMGEITTPEVYVTAELVARFKNIWAQLVTSNHNCALTYPFYHLKSSGFWQLIPRSGFSNLDQLGSLVKSISNLNAAVEYAQLPADLYALMMHPQHNRLLQEVLLQTYFPDTRKNYNTTPPPSGELFGDIEQKILREDPADYKREIDELLKKDDEEEVFLRGSVFKREVPKIYNNTCCISGMRIDTTLNASMVDACHIVPFSKSHDDTITNGIALCPNLHRAFDRGLIAIDDNYQVLVSDAFVESDAHYTMKQLNGKPILLPMQQHYFPLRANLEWHRENVFKL
jgi:putative restriction endonuclease